jgi:phosphoglycolate phosphatase
LKARYLELYVEFIACESKVFEGINSLLERLKREQMPWGIVTNKPQAMSQSLLAALKLSPGVLIGGDTLSVNKPHPEPVLAACRALGVAPNLAVMIGDDRRDIEAGRAAGCATVACAYGYVESAQEAASWGADVCLNESTALDALLA